MLEKFVTTILSPHCGRLWGCLENRPISGCLHPEGRTGHFWSLPCLFSEQESKFTFGNTGTQVPLGFFTFSRGGLQAAKDLENVITTSYYRLTGHIAAVSQQWHHKAEVQFWHYWSFKSTSRLCTRKDSRRYWGDTSLKVTLLLDVMQIYCDFVNE